MTGIHKWESIFSFLNTLNAQLDLKTVNAYVIIAWSATPALKTLTLSKSSQATKAYSKFFSSIAIPVGNFSRLMFVYIMLMTFYVN